MIHKTVTEVDHEKRIMQVTTCDSRWYSRTIKDPVTGLPVWDYVPSVTWICDKGYPKGIGFFKWLAQLGWDEAEAEKEAAGDRGFKVHGAIVALLAGQTVNMACGDVKASEFFNETLGRPEPITLEEYECLMSFMDWFKLAQPEVLESEYTVYDEVRRYAGTIDLKCKFKGCYLDERSRKPVAFKRSEVWIVDFKTSQEVWPGHRMQVSAYRHAEPTADRTAILQLNYRRNQRRWKFTEVADEFPLFLAAREIWQAECEGEHPQQRDYPLSLSLGIEKREESHGTQ